MRLITVVILFFFPFISFSQYYTNENKQWCFGNRAGVDFTSGTPVPYSSSLTNEVRGTASIADPSGNLLLYTNGDTVWNSLHAIMPSGSHIVPFNAGNVEQGAAIVPVIGNSNQYYIFSLEAAGPGSKRRLAYSIVDISLAGGLGDITTSGIVMDSLLGQKMIAIPGNNCNIWLVVHRADSTKFRAYEVTAGGINFTPIVSNVGTFATYFYGVMKTSPDRQLIVASGYGTNGVELYDFNPNTGVVSNCRVINTYYSYGSEFSPDNTKLYTTSYAGSSMAVLQYNISLPTTSAIIASVYTVTPLTVSSHPNLRLAPDNKIYFPSSSGSFSFFLNCIANPNLSGSACGYVSNAVNLSPNQTSRGLPNLYWSVGTVAPITGTTTLCQGTTTTLSSSTPGGTWSSDNTSVATVGSGTGIVSGVAPGTAIISYSTGCGMATTIVTVYANPAPIAGLAGVCVGATTALSNTVPGGTWSSSNTAVATVSGTGVVTGVAIGTSVITYSISGCYTTLTVTVSTSPGAITGTMILCAGATTTLSNAAGTTTCGNDIVTNGGRVLAITSLGTDIKAALNKSYQNAAHIHYDGMYYRRDIGWEF